MTTRRRSNFWFTVMSFLRIMTVTYKPTVFPRSIVCGDTEYAILSIIIPSDVRRTVCHIHQTARLQGIALLPFATLSSRTHLEWADASRVAGYNCCECDFTLRHE